MTDHILVVDEYNITGIIDWTFARIVPAYEAFGPSLLTTDTNDLFTGKAGQSFQDTIIAEVLQSRDNKLGRIAHGPDLVRRFSFGLGMGMGMPSEEAIALSQNIISTATGIIPLGFDWEVWRLDRLYQWAKLQDLLRLQGEIIDYKITVNNTQMHQILVFRERLGVRCLDNEAVPGMSEGSSMGKDPGFAYGAELR